MGLWEGLNCPKESTLRADVFTAPDTAIQSV